MIFNMIVRTNRLIVISSFFKCNVCVSRCLVPKGTLRYVKGESCHCLNVYSEHVGLLRHMTTLMDHEHFFFWLCIIRISPE